jgi:ATP-dependent 26S proteasome regulatory subunit
MFEENKAENLIQSLADRRIICKWSVTEGYSEYDPYTKKYRIPPQDMSIEQVLRLKLSDNTELDRALFVIKDAHIILDNRGNADNNASIAALKEIALKIGAGLMECTVILISPILIIPPEIEKYIAIFENETLIPEDIKGIINHFANEYGQNILPETLEEMTLSFKGLSELEIRQILQLAYADNGELNKQDIGLIFEQKRQMIKKSGILEMIPRKETVDDIGGLENLKKWLKKKAAIIKSINSAIAFGVDTPKGVLIAGVPGCGKSLNAKAAAALFDVPLLRMDMGRIMGKYVGESEENMRKAIALAEAVAPCVLWIDELEKAFSGIGGDGGGAEVTTRLFGNFLTWMQEKDTTVFVVATANDIAKLPPELLRKGRFDEIFYVGLPKKDERAKIFEIHIKKRRECDFDKIDVSKLVEKTEGYSGADIEGVVREAVENAFADGKIALTSEILLDVIKKTHSLLEIMREPLERLSKEYETRKFKNASN